LLSLALSCVLASALAFIYYAESIEGKVVDAKSGNPIEGVILVAHWELKGGWEGGIPVRQLQILEAMTDEGGRYSFPSWGPKFALTGQLRSASPEIFIFKTGYKYRALYNGWHQGLDTTSSAWNRKTIALETFAGTLSEYVEHLSSLSSGLWSAGVDVGDHSGDYCGWTRFPKILRQLDKLEAELRAAGVNRGTVVSDLKANSEKYLREKGCPSVFHVLGGLER
jgi:hypothetical protein